MFAVKFAGDTFSIQCHNQGEEDWHKDGVPIDFNQSTNIRDGAGRSVAIIDVPVTFDGSVFTCTPGGLPTILIIEAARPKVDSVDLEMGNNNVTADWIPPYSRIPIDEYGISVVNTTSLESLYTNSTRETSFMFTQLNIVRCIACGECNISVVVQLKDDIQTVGEAYLASRTPERK